MKWKHYYSDLKYNFHLVTGEPNLSGHLVPFETYASTRRGIATGANHFFTLTQAEVEQWQINQQYLSPCVTRASHLPKQVFTEDDFRQLVAGGKNVFLLNLRDQEVDPKLEAYLAWGESQGYHTRYLTRHRNPWYRMEPATSADLLVKTFGRKPAIFIQNQTQVLNLTCFHGIYFNELGRQYQNLIFLYLLTDLAREIFEGQKRDYGLGLGKFEPNDIKQALVPDFAQLTAEDQEQLTELYQLYIAGLSSKAEEAGLAKEQLLPVSEVVQRAERVFLKYWVKS